MTENQTRTGAIHTFLPEAEEKRLLELLDYLEEKIPAAYRVEVLSYLLPRAISKERELAPPGAPSIAEVRPDSPAPRSRGSKEVESVVALESYLALFARRGDTLFARRGDILLKALATLRFAETQLGVRRLTPTEIVRLQGELDDSHKVYRSNVSNALRKEQALVSRRPRGRGYEYSLTKPGRSRVVRELTLLGIDR